MDDNTAPATKSDVNESAALLRSGMHEGFAQLRSEMREGDAQLRSEMREGDAQLRSEMHEGFAQLRSEMREGFAQLRAEMQHQYDDLVERIHDGQTAILKAFYSYAEGNSKRVTQVEEDGAAVRSRLASLEDRLLEVERRLNFPPAA